MHEVNMTCQVYAQMGEKVGITEKIYDVGSMVCVSKRAECRGGTIHRRS